MELKEDWVIHLHAELIAGLVLGGIEVEWLVLLTGAGAGVAFVRSALIVSKALLRPGHTILTYLIIVPIL